ncbi:hypothetical protein ACQFX9_14710 [Aliinostoc sp. HNIBRCY26]|uniref:hypothetical protein n=1 Tax=Aliinostoc sp. HNIBRCY26 TaxID=3418997 RepID=UPI003D02B3C3
MSVAPPSVTLVLPLLWMAAADMGLTSALRVNICVAVLKLLSRTYATGTVRSLASST